MKRVDRKADKPQKPKTHTISFYNWDGHLSVTMSHFLKGEIWKQIILISVIFVSCPDTSYPMKKCDIQESQNVEIPIAWECG